MKFLRIKIVNEKIFSKFKEKGSDSWFELTSEEILGDNYNSDEWEKIDDILDVWFDSGSTQAFVLEGDEGIGFPANDKIGRKIRPASRTTSIFFTCWL